MAALMGSMKMHLLVDETIEAHYQLLCVAGLSKQNEMEVVNYRGR